MRENIKNMKRATVIRVFVSAYAVLLLMVVAPPCFMAVSGVRTLILGLPLPVFYMSLNGLLIILLVWAFWWVEAVRGETEIFVAPEEG